MTPTRIQVLEASLVADSVELERLQRQNTMDSRFRAARESLTAIRNVVETQRKAVTSLDSQVTQQFDALVASVENGHAQNGHFYQLTESGQRSADAAASSLKNLVAARFTAKVLLRASEQRLIAQEAALSK